jgi:hypothetical protein
MGSITIAIHYRREAEGVLQMNSLQVYETAAPPPPIPVLSAKRPHLYKYFTECRWAHAFLRGELKFRSLSYFRDYEDNNVREDANEGTSLYRPTDGLSGQNLTQGKPFKLEGYCFESTANQEEIFVYCTSRVLTQELWERFGAAACVEILDIGKFCSRVEAALPYGATFPGRPGRNRIGRRVNYYRETDNCNPRWALPDAIATSKFLDYAWQAEFRLVFSLTDALAFEKVSLRLVRDRPKTVSNPAEHHVLDVVVAGGLADMCRLHESIPNSTT